MTDVGSSNLISALLLLVLLCLQAALAAKEGVFPEFRVPPQWAHEPSVAPDLSERIRLTIALHRRNPQKMNDLFWNVSDPKHDAYGDHIVDHEAMRQLISPGRDAVQAVVAWLSSNKAESIRIGRHEDFISCTMALGDIESMLDVQFQMYENKKTHRRIARAVGAFTLPIAVRSVVEVVAGHNGFPITATFKNGQHRPIAVHGGGRLGSPATNVTPSVLFSAYNVTEFPPAPSSPTSIQSFFQADGQFVNQSDLSLFCDLFIKDMPYPVKNLTEQCRIAEFVGNNSNVQPGGNMESSLDSQYILSTSGLAETWVYSYLNLDFCGDLLHWAMDVFELHPDGVYPRVISMSYGVQSAPNYCLGPDVPRLAQDIQKMGTMGISVMIASGDDGSGEYYDHGMEYNYGLLAPSFPASIPYCTAVGATTFAVNNSGTQMATTLFGSGGGFSYSYLAPSYQTDQIAAFFNRSTQLPPLGTYNSSGRGTPDVALLGEGYNVVDQVHDNFGIGGTSCATPVFSGFVTLLNHARLAAKNKTMGFLNPLLYQNPQLFTDITLGTNDVSGDGMGWQCVEGWDPVTGLGTPNIGKMLELVRSLP